MTGSQTSQETIDQFVLFCHGNLADLQQMLSDDPTLINTRSSLGESPLGAAAHVGNQRIAEYLLANGAELELPAAAMLGMNDAVLARLDTDRSLANAAGAHGIPILFHAVIGGNFELAQHLVALGASTSPSLAGSLLHAAIHADHLEMARWTISLGARLDSQDHEGKTPLQRAEARGNTAMVALLTA